MNPLLVAAELHKFIHSLGRMRTNLPEKSFNIGYKPFSFMGQQSKFVSIIGDKNYQCVIIHVDPGKPSSTKGISIQEELHQIFRFNIDEMRKFKRKSHEVYIPFEVISTKERMEVLKGLFGKCMRTLKGQGYE
ncbi:hypothetical protein [Jeotgalibacillus aurantiacus]|uniref:hypothetical protein n=1 Tax=Jeotgalibacillus aurantiacus TaxID=2763266 RepID=UPI001D0A7830|nr:hypothetical protein [Jeotgalibacillus aurantiacus]